MENKDSLIASMYKYLKPPFEKKAIDEIKLGIRLVPKKSDGPIQIGQTKFGGLPDLSNDIIWPLNKHGKPYNFLLQINFLQININSSSFHKLLPSKGLLYFFVDTDSAFIGTVLYENNTINLERRIAPIFKKSRTFIDWFLGRRNYFKIYPEREVEFKPDYTAPNIDSLVFERFIN